MTKAVVITVHGQESIGLNMAALSKRLEGDGFIDDCVFINIRYTKLWTVVNTLPWVRTMTAKYVSARLNAITNQYPKAQIIVVAHSNGTRATRIAMDMRLKPKKKWPGFRIDNLILLGCPIKRNYNWNKHPHTQVVNFISKNDWVVWAARAYGMGSAGRYGFKHVPHNLKQIIVKWGHSGFMNGYSLIANHMKFITRTNDDLTRKLYIAEKAVDDSKL